MISLNDFNKICEILIKKLDQKENMNLTNSPILFQFPDNGEIECKIQTKLDSFMKNVKSDNQTLIEAAVKTQKIIAQLIAVKLGNKALTEVQFNNIFSSLYKEVSNTALSVSQSQDLPVISTMADKLLAIPTHDFDASELHLNLMLTQTIAQTAFIGGTYYRDIILLVKKTCLEWKVCSE